MLNKNTKKSSEIKRELFNCTGEMGMDNFGCLNSSFILFCFYFVTNLRKKFMAYLRLQLNHRLPYTSQYAFSWTTPLPPLSLRTLWMTA